MQFRRLRRREFVKLIGSAAVAWPVRARAQSGERVRRIGVLMPTAAHDRDGQDRISALLQGLQQSGWSVGRNIRMEYRWEPGDVDAVRKRAAELVELAPDLIIGNGSMAVGPLLQLTRTIPIVFATVADPVGLGYVNSLARPGRNATGFVLYEFALAGKWLEVLKELAPQTTRVGVLRDASQSAGIGQFAAIQSVAPSLGVELKALDAHDGNEIERAVTEFARTPNGGLIVTGGAQVVTHRELTTALAARYKLPAVYFRRTMVESGGLVSYGPDLLDQYRQAAGYVDRILKGEKPADLPVQAPTKYELVINLKTAKALGLEVPATLLARADEVIE
jgi:putative tryptophan/tyrosine transport system substrate-binding protein